jgi:hypothetical protein
LSRLDADVVDWSLPGAVAANSLQPLKSVKSHTVIVEMELPRRAPVVIVGLELTEFTTGATGKVGPTGVIVFEAGFKVGVCWPPAIVMAET